MVTRASVVARASLGRGSASGTPSVPVAAATFTRGFACGLLACCGGGAVATCSGVAGRNHVRDGRERDRDRRVQPLASAHAGRNDPKHHRDTNGGDGNDDEKNKVRRAHDVLGLAPPITTPGEGNLLRRSDRDLVYADDPQSPE